MTTTHRLTYGMADTYPELYQQAIAAGRAQPAPNLNFRSAWGESLSKAAQAAADLDQATGRSKLLSRGARQTTYAEFNNQVRLAFVPLLPSDTTTASHAQVSVGSCLQFKMLRIGSIPLFDCQAASSAAQRFCVMISSGNTGHQGTNIACSDHKQVLPSKVANAADFA